VNEFYCTICSKWFQGTWKKAFESGWVYKKVKGIEHTLCPDHANEVIEGESQS